MEWLLWGREGEGEEEEEEEESLEDKSENKLSSDFGLSEKIEMALEKQWTIDLARS